MAYDITASSALLALLGGFLPALLWLWFWQKEDRHPEPRGILLLTFSAGMVMAVVALFLEQFARFLAEDYLGAVFSPEIISIILLIVWALIEEVAKYAAAWRVALRRPCFDEPVDALIYLITVALGFASLENLLFLLKIFGTQGSSVGFLTGNLRFLGATLLHVVASGAVGASIAFSFFHKEKLFRNVLGGLFLATALHTLFNFFIIKGEGGSIFKVFIPLWLLAIVLIFIFEKIKGPKNLDKNYKIKN